MEQGQDNNDKYNSSNKGTTLHKLNLSEQHHETTWNLYDYFFTTLKSQILMEQFASMLPELQAALLLYRYTSLQSYGQTMA